MSTKKKTELPKKEKSNLQRKGPPPMPARGMAVSFLLMAIFLTQCIYFRIRRKIVDSSIIQIL